MIVTKAEQNVIRELGRRPALEVLREIFEELAADDQERVQQGLHIGRVINEYQETFQRGDFLVRNVIGRRRRRGDRRSPTSSASARPSSSTSATPRPPTRTSASLLEHERLARPDARIAGALLFTCNGRGTRLFAEPRPRRRP